MKGDFTRSTFRADRHYSGVRMQQGRVTLDSDWNEQLDITAHRDETAGLDAIGQNGGPRQNAGFALAPSADQLPEDQRPPAKAFEPLKSGDLFVSAGRYYVDGILCENEHPVTLAQQPDGGGGGLPDAPGVYLAYLDVWQRHLTALDDPGILEVALGGPDTATRTKTVWQVKLIKVPGDATCGSGIPASAETAGSTGKLTARAAGAPATNDPCMLEPGAGYRRLENQLYRVEIHDSGVRGAATFKWSRDNGSVVTAWLVQNGNDLTVSSVGKDGTLGFAVGDCVELSDDSHELRGAPGTLVKVVKINGQTLTIDPGTTVIDRAAFPLRPKVRRWNMEDGEVMRVDLPAANDGFIELEDGVEIKFEPGTYRTGDYWLIPARTATGSVDWPFSEPQPVQGILHHYCRLGLLTFDGALYTSIQDCRELFPPATQLTSLLYVGGSGQVGGPGQMLPFPLQAGVSMGRWPVPGATVRFSVSAGSGTLDSGKTSLDVVTDANGIASCPWRLGFNTSNQQVEATLLDPAKVPVHLPVRFTATFCEDAQDPGIQIEKILLGNGEILDNDTEVGYDRVGEGIDVACSASIAPGTASRATCFLTLEVPFPISGTDVGFWGDGVIGYQPLVVAATARVEGPTILWRPTPRGSEFLKEDLFARLTELNRNLKVLARLTLLGNFIWQEGKEEISLDADAFGMRLEPGALEPTRLRLPSGDGRRGGRLDMWFWVVAPISITISPNAVQIRPPRDRAVFVTFTVTITGTENTAAELSVNGDIGGNPVDGTITLSDEAKGIWTYRSPLGVGVSGLARVVTVEARSLADRTRVARAPITLLSPDFNPGDFGGVIDRPDDSGIPGTRPKAPLKRPSSSGAPKRSARKQGKKKSGR